MMCCGFAQRSKDGVEVVERNLAGSGRTED